jgi:hypothetical protein
VTALSNQIIYIMKRAVGVNKRIDGKLAYQSMDKNKDKFLIIKEDNIECFHYIEEKRKEKTKSLLVKNTLTLTTKYQS